MAACTRCGFAETHRQHVIQCTQGGVTLAVTNVTPPVTRPATVTPPVTPQPDERHVCPVCGDEHGRARTNAQRQQAYRERRQAT